MCKRELAEAIARNLPGHLIDLLRVCVEGQSRTPGGPVGGKWFKYACDQQGVAFHPAWLTKLANEKLLIKCEGGQGGHRRDYRIADDELARLVLVVAKQHVGHVAGDGAIKTALAATLTG